MKTHHHTHQHEGMTEGAAHGPRGLNERALILAILVTGVFMAVEYAGGWLANSLALMTDATHMLTDVGALSISLIAIWIARRPVSPRMSFGYHRAEILGALLSGFLIWLICGFLIYEAIVRLAHPPEVKGQWVLLIAVAGLGVNLLALRILHPAHSGGGLNIHAAYLHVVSDLLGSLAAVIAGGVILFTGWTLIDPLLSFLVAGLVLFSSWRLVAEAVSVLMESAPPGINPGNVEADLRALPCVEGVHDLHIWAVTSGLPALSVHLLGRNSEEVLRTSQELLRTRYGISHTTIQVEHPEGSATEECEDCGRQST